MRSTARLRKQPDVEIEDYYALRIGAMWRGLRQESWAFWWLCVYMFFEYVRPEIIYPQLQVLPWTQLALLFSLASLTYDKTVKWVRTPINPILVAFFIVVFLSSLFAFRPSLSWEKIDIVINWLIIYFLIIAVVNSERRFFIFLLLFLLVNFKMSQFGFRSFVMRGFSFAGWGVSGSPGWFTNAGDFGMQMTIFVPLALVFAIQLKSYWGVVKKLLFFLIPVTGLVTIVATSSRGAMLGLVAIAVWYFLKSRFGIRAIISLAIIGWALYSILPQEMIEKVETAGDDGTSQARLVYWGFGVDVAKSHPLLGVGYENWLSYCWYKNPHGIEPGTFCLDPHNTFVEAAAETGITGLILYLLLVIKAFSVNLDTRRNSKITSNKLIFYLSHALDAGLVGYLASSMFVTVLFYPVFWVQLAMIVALNNVSRNQLESAAG